MSNIINISKYKNQRKFKKEKMISLLYVRRMCLTQHWAAVHRMAANTITTSTARAGHRCVDVGCWRKHDETTHTSSISSNQYCKLLTFFWIFCTKISVFFLKKDITQIQLQLVLHTTNLHTTTNKQRQFFSTRDRMQVWLYLFILSPTKKNNWSISVIHTACRCISASWFRKGKERKSTWLY